MVLKGKKRDRIEGKKSRSGRKEILYSFRHRARSGRSAAKGKTN